MKNNAKLKRKRCQCSHSPMNSEWFNNDADLTENFKLKKKKKGENKYYRKPYIFTISISTSFYNIVF